MEFDVRRVSGDRVYAVQNAEGKIGSAKNTRRFTRVDGLLSLSAKTSVNGIIVTFPDGKILQETDRSIQSKLSQTSRQKVILSKEAKVPHFDDGSVHLLTTSSLSLLRDLLPKSTIDPWRFRPDIVIDSPYIDQDFVGKTLKIGTAALQVTEQAQRCRMIALEQSELEKRPEILKAVADKWRLYFDLYARVLTTGAIAKGDKVDTFFLGKPRK